MDNLEVNWGDVIRAASENPLGLVALVVLVLAVVAVLFFRGAGNAVKLSVFGMLAVSFVGLAAVVLHERGDLQQTVEQAKKLSQLADGVDSGLTALETGGAGDSDARAGAVLANTAMLSEFVEARPALEQQATASDAQRRLAAKRTAMLPHKDPRTGEVRPGPQALDADTKGAARDLSRAVAESLKGKDALQLRELLREKQPGG